MESSGNRDYHCGSTSRGVDTVQTNLHFGPQGLDHHWSNYTLKSNDSVTYADDFHIWGIQWNENFLSFEIDGEEIYRLTAPGAPGGLFDYAGFTGDNIYKNEGPMAPFDQEFYFILSFGSGGWPFYDYCEPPAPWGKESEYLKIEFWEARHKWFGTWKQPFIIDYLRVYKRINTYFLKCLLMILDHCKNFVRISYCVFFLIQFIHIYQSRYSRWLLAIFDLTNDPCSLSSILP